MYKMRLRSSKKIAENGQRESVDGNRNMYFRGSGFCESDTVAMATFPTQLINC